MGVKGLLRGFRLPLSTSTISTIICLSFPQSLAESASGSRTTLSIGISATTMNTDTLSSTASVGCGKSMLSLTLPYSLSISPHTKNRLSYIAMADSVNDPSTMTPLHSMRGNMLMDFYALRHRAKKMVRQFRKCGFKLIVFIDANISTKKLNEWMSRRARRVANVVAINEKLNKYRGHTHGFDHLWFPVRTLCSCDIL